MRWNFNQLCNASPLDFATEQIGKRPKAGCPVNSTPNYSDRIQVGKPGCFRGGPGENWTIVSVSGPHFGPQPLLQLDLKDHQKTILDTARRFIAANQALAEEWEVFPGVGRRGGELPYDLTIFKLGHCASLTLKILHQKAAPQAEKGLGGERVLSHRRRCHNRRELTLRRSWKKFPEVVSR